MRARAAAVAALAACLIVLAGCGGGGDENSTSSAASVPQVTTPGEFNPSRGSTSTATSTAPGTTPGNPPAPRNLPPGAQPVEQALAPFRACLSHHGVDPMAFSPGSQQGQQQTPTERQEQIQAGFACIPELPPQMQAAAERLKRRYEQRNG